MSDEMRVFRIEHETGVLCGQKTGKMSALAVYKGSDICSISNKTWGAPLPS